MRTPKVFISFCQHDSRKCASLRRMLERSSPPFEPVVVASRRDPGKALSDKVIDGIREADHFIAILTSSSIAAQWVNQEIGYATAVGRTILSVVERGIMSDLKGFVHAQQDLPFTFDSFDGNSRREARSFREACLLVSSHLLTVTGDMVFQARVEPTRLKAGEPYTTTVEFKGAVVNGFFDNLVQHEGSSFKKWNWDPSTFKAPRGENTSSWPGELNGTVDVRRTYSHSTKGWPTGMYRIYVRLYSHPTPGEKGRQVVAESVHQLKVR